MSEPTNEKISLGATKPADNTQGQPQPQVYNVPVTTVRLPSRGKAYSSDSPLYGCDEVEIRSMTARDEDILTSRALLKKGTAISSLLRSCLMDKTIDPDDMLVGDRNAVLIALRASGYGREYKATVECPDCEEAFDHSFDLGAFKVIELKADPIAEDGSIFEFLLPVSKMKVQFKLLTGNEEKEMTKVLEKMKKARGVGAVEEGVTMRLFYQIVSLGGINDRVKISRAVKNMPAGDSLKLRTYISNISPGLEMKQEIECPHCTESSEVEMPMGIDFFWPGS